MKSKNQVGNKQQYMSQSISISTVLHYNKVNESLYKPRRCSPRDPDLHLDGSHRSRLADPGETELKSV